MEIKHRYYPHPVLTYYGSDFKSGTFVAGVELEIKDKEVEFSFYLSTDCSTLIDLIKAGVASYCVHIECAGTFYREILQIDKDGRLVHTIPYSKIEGLVNVCSFIAAAEDIPNYQGPDFHDDYSGITFNINKGAVLAVAEQSSFRIEHAADELARVPSIFMILEHNDNEAKEMAVDLGEQRILLYLPKDDYYRYKSVMGDTMQQPIFHSAMILPALTYVLTELKKPGNDLYMFEDKRWFRSLTKKLHDNGIDINNDDFIDDVSILTAQALLDYPITKTLDYMTTNEGEEEDY